MVDIVETPEPEEAPINPRDAAMQDIIDANRELRTSEDDNVENTEITGDNEDLAEIPAPPENLELADTPDPAPENVDNAENIVNTPIIERDGVQYLITQVNGTMVETPVDQAITRLQVQQNADLQTQLAVESRQKYEAMIRQGSITPQPVFTPSDDTPEVDADKIRGDMQSALQKLYDSGDVETSAETITDTLLSVVQQSAQPSHPAMTQDQVRQIAAQATMEVNSQQEAMKALNRFKSDDRFKILSDDPMLLGLVDQETAVIGSDHNLNSQNMTYDQIFEEAGKRVLSRIHKVSPQQESTETLAEISKEQTNRKRNIAPSIPSAASHRPTAPEAPAPLTKSDIIANIARGRGQDVLNN